MDNTVDYSDILRVSTHEEYGIPIVLAEGDVDLATTPSLRLILEASCNDRNEAGILAVDMRQVPFIDSAGLALLVEIRKRFISKCHLALVIEKGSQPERVLKLGRFDTFLQVCYSTHDLLPAATAATASDAV